MAEGYKAIFFDAGYTLIRPVVPLSDLFLRAFEGSGVALDKKWVKESFDKAVRDLISQPDTTETDSDEAQKEWVWKLFHKTLHEDEGAKAQLKPYFERFYQAFYEPDLWKPFPEVERVLKALKEREFTLGIISNAATLFYPLFEILGLEGYFDFLLISSHFGFKKPSKAIFDEALRLARVRPREALHVGDSYHDDLMGALEAGLDAALIDRGKEAILPRRKPPENHKGARGFLIYRLEELLKILDNDSL